MPTASPSKSTLRLRKTCGQNNRDCAAKRPPEKNDQLLWEGHDGVLEHMPFFTAVVLTLFGVFLRTTLGTFGGVDEDLITPLQSSHQRLSSAIAFVQSPLSPSPRTQPPGGRHGLRQAATSGKALNL